MKERAILITSSDMSRLRRLLESALNLFRHDRPYLEVLKRELEAAKVVESDRIPRDLVTLNTELATDIIAASDFYNLPLDVFLGIGAMENNYLSIRGDINHAIWKRSPAKDDIVLKRGRHRVLVSDYSIGVWQITQTLRYAHALFLKDKRDYSQLPERLRPPRH